MEMLFYVFKEELRKRVRAVKSTDVQFPPHSSHPALIAFDIRVFWVG